MSAASDYEIDIRIDDDCWPYLRAEFDTRATQAIGAICSHIDVRPFSELSIALLSDAEVRALNKQYRGQDKATNVLSFPASADGSCPLLGDIVLASETLSVEAAAKNISLKNHLSHLLIHGFLHLQGYDHETDADAKIMEALEIKALADLGITNPYVREDES